MTVAGWYEDPDTAENYRYWDGSTWTTDRKPALVHLAERQLSVSRRIEQDTRSIRAMLIFIVIVIIIGIVGAIISGFVLGSKISEIEDGVTSSSAVVLIK